MSWSPPSASDKSAFRCWIGVEGEIERCSRSDLRRGLDEPEDIERVALGGMAPTRIELSVAMDGWLV